MKRYSLEQKAQVIKEIKDTGNAAVVARKHGLPYKTVYAWIYKENRPSAHPSKKYKDLEEKIKEQELEIAILKELLKKTNQAWLKN